MDIPKYIKFFHPRKFKVELHFPEKEDLGDDMVELLQDAYEHDGRIALLCRQGCWYGEKRFMDVNLHEIPMWRILSTQLEDVVLKTNYLEFKDGKAFAEIEFITEHLEDMYFRNRENYIFVPRVLLSPVRESCPRLVLICIDMDIRRNRDVGESV